MGEPGTWGGSATPNLTLKATLTPSLCSTFAHAQMSCGCPRPGCVCPISGPEPFAALGSSASGTIRAVSDSEYLSDSECRSHFSVSVFATCLSLMPDSWGKEYYNKNSVKT